MALIFLLILTLIAVTAVTSSSLGEKMAANLKDQRTAFQAAEAALRAAEGWITSLNYSDPTKIIPENTGTACTTATTVCKQNLLGNLGDQSAYPNSWWKNYAVAYGSNLSAADQPRYVAEFRAFEMDDPSLGKDYGKPGRAFYRVTGFGVGATESATAVVQSHFGVHVNPPK